MISSHFCPIARKHISILFIRQHSSISKNIYYLRKRNYTSQLHRSSVDITYLMPKKWAINGNISTTYFSTESKNMDQNEIKPSNKVRGMTILDRNAFSREISLPSILIRNENLSVFTKKKKKKHPSHFSELCLKMRGLKPIRDLPDGDEMKASHKTVLIRPELIIDGKLKSDILDTLSPLIGIESCEIKYQDFTLNYDNWDYQEVLKAILPEDVSGVGGFSLVGHILHLNLKSDMLDYKSIIGKIKFIFLCV